jgi:hypothetical protein
LVIAKVGLKGIAKVDRMAYLMEGDSEILKASPMADAMVRRSAVLLVVQSEEMKGLRKVPSRDG